MFKAGLILALLTSTVTGMASATAVLPKGASELVYVSIRTGDPQIWLRDAQGKEHMLTDGKGLNAQPSISRDGRIAFVAREAGRPVIMVMQHDGTDKHRLTADKAVELAPSWAPDNGALAYFTIDAVTGATALRIADLRTQASLEVMSTGRAKGPSAPVWSADGQRLAFLAADDKGRSHVWIVQRDGSGLRDVSASFTPRAANWVDISPDGKQVVWIADMREQSTHIVLTNLESGESRDLTADVVGGHEAARWSPDGKQIAFASTRDDPVSFRSDIFVMDADGRNVRNLSRNPAEDFDPKWSPDGRRIVYASLRNGGTLLFEVDLVTSQSAPLSTHTSHDMDHAVRPVAQLRQ